MSGKGRAGQGSSELKLQSYKLDSSVLVSRINELNQLRSELESSLSKHRLQENSIVDELALSRHENAQLKTQLNTLEFTRRSQQLLIDQLEKRLEEAEQKAASYLQMYENEERNKRELSAFYQQKKEEETVRAGVSHRRDTTQTISQSDDCEHFHVSIDSLSGDLKQDSAKKIKRLKKPSIQPEGKRISNLSEKYMTENVIIEKEEDSHLSGEDVYLEMIRHLYKQLIKIEIKAKDLIKIPQIESFSQLRGPTRNDLAKLCASYPFHIRQEQKIGLIHDFIHRELDRKGLLFNGKTIINEVIRGIEEIETEMEAKSDYSSFLNDSDKKIGSYRSEALRRANAKQSEQHLEKQSSIASNNESDSQTSLFF